MKKQKQNEKTLINSRYS